MIKPIYSCTAVILAILAGAVLFRPHVLKTMPGSETATRSVVLREAKPEQKIRLAENYGKLPLSFEANKGQTDGRVKFLSRGRGDTESICQFFASVFSRFGNSRPLLYIGCKLCKLSSQVLMGSDENLSCFRNSMPAHVNPGTLRVYCAPAIGVELGYIR